MIHLVIYLPLEALERGPIRPRWMYPFERYIKKLKGYVRNKAKPEGSIAEVYVAEEALTFSSHYFWDVTTKFNRPDRNVDPPLPTCQFQKVKWYVLHNSPEIDTYRSQFKSLFPNKDMKEEFPDWFGSQIRQRHVDNDKDPEVSTTSELFALACGPTWTPISINSCVVDGVRYVVHSRDERHITQNNGICSPGPNGEMYYGQLQEILKFKYLLFKVVLFRVKWFDTRNKGRKVKRLVLRNNMTQIDTRAESFKDDQYILVTQVKQVFYLEDKAKPYWRVVEHVNHKKFSDGGVIVVEDDPDIIHFDNSSDLPLLTSLNDLDNVTLHIDGQSTKVDVPPDIIIDVVDEDDDITDDEDALPHDLAESDNEDLINVDDDGVDKQLKALRPTPSSTTMPTTITSLTTHITTLAPPLSHHATQPILPNSQNPNPAFSNYLRNTYGDVEGMFMNTTVQPMSTVHGSECGWQSGSDHHLQKLNMPLFDGEDVYGWVYQVERFFEVQALITIGGRLSWEEIKRRLLHHFQPLQNDNLLEQFVSISQQGTTREYVTLFEKMAAQLPNLTEEVLGEFLSTGWPLS
nr:hypothetical protein [Tanacetum cinerariifolium]